MAFTEDEDLALHELVALAKMPGSLKIITNEHACGVTLEPLSEQDLQTCIAYQYPVSDPRHFVLHDVIGIEPREEAGYVRAYSAEGDWTDGKPAAVLMRLRQWRVP